MLFQVSIAAVNPRRDGYCGSDYATTAYPPSGSEIMRGIHGQIFILHQSGMGSQILSTIVNSTRDGYCEGEYGGTGYPISGGDGAETLRAEFNEVIWRTPGFSAQYLFQRMERASVLTQALAVISDERSIHGQATVAPGTELELRSQFVVAPEASSHIPVLALVAPNARRALGGEATVAPAARRGLGSQFLVAPHTAPDLGTQATAHISTERHTGAQGTVSPSASYVGTSQILVAPVTLSGVHTSISILASPELDVQATIAPRTSISRGFQFMIAPRVMRPVPTQATVQVQSNPGGRMQWLARIDSETALPASVDVAVDRKLRGSFQVTIAPRSFRKMRAQIRFRSFFAKSTGAQFYFYYPYEHLFGPSAYATSDWPSARWPYVTGEYLARRIPMQAKFTPMIREHLCASAIWAMRVRSGLGVQFAMNPFVLMGMNTSFYAPNTSDVERGTPALCAQWQFSKAESFNTEVRWRPF